MMDRAQEFDLAKSLSFGCVSGVKSILLVLALLSTPPHLARAHPPGAEVATAINNFLAALKPEQRSKAEFEFTNLERVNWHFIPRERKGLPFAELTPAQKHLAHSVLASALSHRGYLKAVTIMSLEQILHDMENQSPRRNPDLYFFSVFGEPGVGNWGLRIEGHHLSLNFTARGDEILAATPSFFGSNPAEVRTGPRAGLRVLAFEEQLGRQLVKSLDARQLAVALITNVAPKEILTGDARRAMRLDPPGLSAGRMNKSQRATLEALIKEYLGRNRAELAEADWKQVKAAGWGKIHFAWAGGLQPGQGHYYRVQGPSFLLEYDNTQDGANHIHAVWRDLKNDFGDDVLQQHYQQTPHEK